MRHYLAQPKAFNDVDKASPFSGRDASGAKWDVNFNYVGVIFLTLVHPKSGNLLEIAIYHDGHEVTVPKGFPYAFEFKTRLQAKEFLQKNFPGLSLPNINMYYSIWAYRRMLSVAAKIDLDRGTIGDGGHEVYKRKKFPPEIDTPHKFDDNDRLMSSRTIPLGNLMMICLDQRAA